MSPFRVLWKRRALERSCHWTREELHRRQASRLADLREFVMARSPFYRRTLRGMEGAPLHALPVLTKAAMMEHFDELVTDRTVRLADVEAFLRSGDVDGFFHGRYVVLATSGSTGRRGVLLFDSGEWLTSLAMIARPTAWAGVRARAIRRPRLAVIASTTPWHYSSRVTTTMASRFLPALRLDASEPVETIVSRLNSWQPEVLTVYPSVLTQLADAQIAGRLRIQPRTIATSAEVLPEETRRRVRQAWGLRVFDTYSASEYAPISAECQYGRKHLLEDEAIIEIVDERGRPVPTGARGDRLLLTIFDRRTQPLIRYEISDMVRPAEGSCECGRPFRMIDSIEGRLEDVLDFPARDGQALPVSIHPNVFHRLLEAVPASGWQVRQEDEGVSVLLTGLRDPSMCESIGTSIRRTLEAQGALVGSVRVTSVDALDRGATGKAPLVLARRRQTNAGAV